MRGQIRAPVATTGCAGFEQTLGTLGPGSPSAIVSSLIGTWNSSSAAASGSSCTNVQWRVTSQSANALSGEFSADCVGGVSASGAVSGQPIGGDVPYQVTGSATVPGGVVCAFSITGTARVEGDAIRIPYSGSTCLGPLRGEEVVRLAAPPAAQPAPQPAPAPVPPVPAPPAVPPPGGNVHHVGPGPLTSARAEQVVKATRDEFPSLWAARGSEAEGVAATTELLRRMIWHLQLAGFQAGRQRNPSGAISGDKLTVFADGGIPD